MRASIVVVTAAALLMTACTGGGEPGKPSPTSTVGYADCEKNPNTCNSGDTKLGGAYTYGLQQSVTSWNVNTKEGSTPATHQALSGLLPQVYRADPDGRLQLNTDLVISADLTNQNPETVVYKIRPDAVWNDGIAITSDDFLLAWKQKSGKPEHCSACAPASTAGYDVIKSIVGSDGGKTVTVTFTDGKTFADWRGNFSTDGLYPAHLATKQGFDLAKPEGVSSAADWFARTVPTWSGGPFQIESFTKDQSVVLKKNEKWYGKTKPALDRITFKFMLDQNAVLPALRAKELTGMVTPASQALVTGVAATPGVVYRVGHGNSWESVELNVRNKYLADPHLRQALFTAINVKTVIEKTYGTFDKTAKPLGSHNFLPGDANYKDVVTGTKQGSGDTDRAKKILTDAGYKIENGKLLTKTNEVVPPLRFRFDKGNQARTTTGEVVQSALKSIGLDVRLEPSETYSQTLTTGDFDLAAADWTDNPLFLEPARRKWVTAGPSNYGGYTNPEVDRLIGQAGQEVDAKRGAELLNQADELLTKDAFVLPLTQLPTLTFTYQEYVNVRDNPSQWGPTYNLEEWGLRAT